MKFIEQLTQKRKFQYGANNTLVIIGMLVVVILLNVVVGALNERSSLSIDLSANQMFALTDATEEMLKSLEKDVNIYHLTLPATERAAVTEVLKNYERASDHIHTEQVNYETNPTFVSGYTSQTLSDNSLIVESDGRSKVIDFNSMVADGTEFVLERELTNTIAAVVSGAETAIYYTSGHGEADFSSISSALTGENVSSTELSLLTEDIPEDCSLLWINTPQTDFSAEEIEKIDAYAASGGKVQVTLDPEYHPENLCTFIEECGLIVNDDIVTEMDADFTLSDNPFLFVANLNIHEITERLSNVYIRVFKSSSIAAGTNDAVTLTPLLASSTQGVSYDLAESAPFNSGTQMVAVLSENYETGAAVSVFASGQVFASDVLSDASFGNHALLVSLVDYLTEGDLAGVSVEGKSLEVGTLVLSTSQQRTLWLVTFLLLPVIIFGTGIYVWQKRRHL